MSPRVRRFVSIAGGLAVAAAIAYFPWSLRDDIPVEADTFYWMTAILWAPTASVVGIAAGLWFGYRRWPRRRRHGREPEPPARAPDRSSIEA